MKYTILIQKNYEDGGHQTDKDTIVDIWSEELTPDETINLLSYCIDLFKVKGGGNNG